jgi:hypothetical protein
LVRDSVLWEGEGEDEAVHDERVQRRTVVADRLYHAACVLGRHTRVGEGDRVTRIPALCAV